MSAAISQTRESLALAPTLPAPPAKRPDCVECDGQGAHDVTQVNGACKSERCLRCDGTGHEPTYWITEGPTRIAHAWISEATYDADGEALCGDDFKGVEGMREEHAGDRSCRTCIDADRALDFEDNVAEAIEQLRDRPRMFAPSSKVHAALVDRGHARLETTSYGVRMVRRAEGGK